jgi:hypothetical protein
VKTRGKEVCFADGVRLGEPRRKEGCAVEWDLGLRGLGLLLVMSGIFGLVAEVLAGRRICSLMPTDDGRNRFRRPARVSSV